MNYHGIMRTVQMGRSTAHFSELAEEEYNRRMAWPSTFSSQIMLDGEHELFVVMTRKLAELSDAIQAYEIRIQQLWNTLPGIAGGAYLSDLLANEMLTTTRMEGVRSTRGEMDEALGAVAAGKTNKRFAELARLYVSFVDGAGTADYPRTLQELRDIYDRIVDGELGEGDEPDGDLFRKEAVQVTDPAQGSVHEGLVPESAIQVALTQMLTFARGGDMPAMLKAVVCHYIFEYVHPFYDGNGRTGRFLLSLQLRRGLCVPTVLSISPVIAENKGRYDKAFEQAEKPYNCSELTFFAEIMLGFIRDAQRSLLEDLQDRTKALDDASLRLREYEKSRNGIDGHRKNIIFYLIQDGLFGEGNLSRSRICGLEGIGYARVRTILDGLVEEGVAETRGVHPICYGLSEKGRAFFGVDGRQTA